MLLGEFIREKRLSLEITLRKFAILMEMDASNWSKIERDVLPFPEDDEKLSNLAEYLDIEKGSTEWTKMLDLISVSKRRIPEHVYEDKEILSVLPIFFRTAKSNNRPSREELEEIIKILKER